MKLYPLIKISASKKEFCFSDGAKECRFRPVVYLSSEKRVLSVGDAPMQGGVDQEARIFEDPKSCDDSFAVLEAMMRHGIREVTGPLRLIPPTVQIMIDPGLQEQLGGFAPSVFYFAARNAGATKITIQ
jgi:hypothetical protein